MKNQIKMLVAAPLLFAAMTAKADSPELMDSCRANLVQPFTEKVLDYRVSVIKTQRGLFANQGAEGIPTRSGTAKQVEFTIREGIANADLDANADRKDLNHGEMMIGLLSALQSGFTAEKTEIKKKLENKDLSVEEKQSLLKELVTISAAHSGIQDLSSVRSIKGYVLSQTKIGAVPMDDVLYTAYDKDQKEMGKFIYISAFPAACHD